MYLVYGDGGVSLLEYVAVSWVLMPRTQSDWVSYDDTDTFNTKVNFAKDAGFVRHDHKILSDSVLIIH